MLIRKKRLLRKPTVAAMAFALVFPQTAPAMAYGPGDGFGWRDDVRAMVDFRLLLGAPQAGIGRAPSFGFTVRRQFQFNDRPYETVSGSHRNSQRLTVDAVNLRFGTNGKLNGFEVGGFNAFQAKTRLNAADNGNGGTPSWVWWALGGAAVVGGVVLAVGALNSDSDPCSNRDFFAPPSVECGDFDAFLGNEIGG